MAIKNELKSLAEQLSRGSSGDLSLNRSLSPITLLPAASRASKMLYKPPSSGEQKGSSTTDVAKEATGLKFGSPSDSKAATTASGYQWGNLLSQTASGGLSNAFGGGLLNAVGGLGGLVSSIAGLFGGGKKTEAPLVHFQLPTSENETAYVGSKGSSVYQGSAVESSSGVANSSSAVSSNGVSGPTYQYQSQQIVQAVKQALLNSSSLNDVIAEI